MSSSKEPREQGKCRIAEIVQYTCDIERPATGDPIVHCFPIPRIFRICPGKPVVEITTKVDIDITTGEVEIPSEKKQLSIKGRHWTEVIRYNEDHSEK
ncbi:hypothetical protein BDQ12DRAFT_604667 [Crucibulum laeve]|uniref:Uncharacterized protein n=1 Tax=Crucibulum laeve TaxID=68775 RepID=A0A5C3M3T4_9AGAR|nr:hypothetical protein BDQ12DRAFT_604667 [Crucibulum laeve]